MIDWRVDRIVTCVHIAEVDVMILTLMGMCHSLNMGKLTFYMYSYWFKFYDCCQIMKNANAFFCYTAYFHPVLCSTDFPHTSLTFSFCNLHHTLYYNAMFLCGSE